MKIILRDIFIFIALQCSINSSAIPLNSNNQSWIVHRVIREESSTTTSSTVEEISPPRIYSMVIDSNIRLRYANTKLTSRVANPATKAQEAVFQVVLPETAFISGFLMEIDGKVYEASVKEKEKAKEEYESAVSQGQTAAHVATNSRDANRFTVSVNLEPNSKVSFNLTYEELLTRRRGIYEQAIHINPGVTVRDFKINVKITEVLPITTLKVPQLRNDLQEEGEEKDNPLAVITRINETQAEIVYQPNENQQKQISTNGLQGQFVIQYDVDRTSVEKKGGEIHLVDGYFVHYFAPESLKPLPKHVVFVLDTSGSMYGTKIDQTKQAMQSILDQLRSEDIFSVVEFSSDVVEWDLRKAYKPPTRYYNDEAVNATEATTEIGPTKAGQFDDVKAYEATKDEIKRANQFVSSMQATGGTNINDALTLALKNIHAVQQRVKRTPIIIFLTDGEPTSGETRIDSILSNIRKANSDGVVTIFSLAFGTGADFEFLKKISLQNKGFARKIYEASDATLQLKGFFEEIASPKLSEIEFKYDGPVEDVTDTKIPNYFSGSELVVAGRYSGSFKANISANGAEQPYSVIWDDKFLFPILPPILPPKKPTVKDSFSLEKIWAYLTIKELLRKNEAEDNKDLHQKALNLSLTYKFVTPVTSLLVIKPNDSSSQADLKPADSKELPLSIGFIPLRVGGGSVGFSASAGFGGSAGLSGVFHQSLHPFVRPPVAHVLSRPPLRPQPFFTTTRPVNTANTETTGPTQEELVESTTFFQPEWLLAYHHNETHIFVTKGNDTLTLLWNDHLVTYSWETCVTKQLTGDVVGHCKLIADCQLFTGSLQPSDICALQNTHLGKIEVSRYFLALLYHAAEITNNEAVEEALMRAGLSSGDLTFPLPYCPELHFPEFASAVADMINSVAVSGSVNIVYKTWKY